MPWSIGRVHLIEKLTPIYQGRVIQLNIERVRLPNDAVADLEIVHHPGGAAIVAVDTAQRVCLLRQYRHAAANWIWELPAGKIDNRESPFATAQRELAEEAGMHAAQWRYLGKYLSSPGVFTEIIHLYLAKELSPVPSVPEEHEVFQVEWRPLADVIAMTHNGELCDGKSIVGVLRAAHELAQTGRA
jgi:8-oxo-dGTP pyrophosphatase MutT (NUDIX family)